MKTRIIPAVCSGVGCNRAAVQSRLVAFGSWISRCEKHDGKEITIDFNKIVDHKHGGARDSAVNQKTHTKRGNKLL